MNVRSSQKPYGPIQWIWYEIEHGGLQGHINVTIPLPTELPLDEGLYAVEAHGVLEKAIAQKVGRNPQYESRTWTIRNRSVLSDEDHRALFPNESRPEGY